MTKSDQTTHKTHQIVSLKKNIEKNLSGGACPQTHIKKRMALISKSEKYNSWHSSSQVLATP